MDLIDKVKHCYLRVNKSYREKIGARETEGGIIFYYKGINKAFACLLVDKDKYEFAYNFDELGRDNLTNFKRKKAEYFMQQFKQNYDNYKP